jgi:hypothetical protein
MFKFSISRLLFVVSMLLIAVFTTNIVYAGGNTPINTELSILKTGKINKNKINKRKEMRKLKKQLKRKELKSYKSDRKRNKKKK